MGLISPSTNFFTDFSAFSVFQRKMYPLKSTPVEFVAHTLVNFQFNSFDESVGMAKINILVQRELFKVKSLL